MIKELTGILTMAILVFASGAALSGTSWESTTAALAEIEITTTTDGTKVFSYKNHGFLLSAAEGDGVLTCTGGGVITESGTMLRLACEVTDRDGDKRHFLIDRSADESFVKGQGYMRSAGGTGKHADRKYECVYDYFYMPKIDGMDQAPVVTNNNCDGDLPSESD